MALVRRADDLDPQECAREYFAQSADWSTRRVPKSCFQRPAGPSGNNRKGVTMKVLLINPEFPDTYWSFHHALPFEGKRSAFPPLGLLTVSALLPPSWERRLVDI